MQQERNFFRVPTGPASDGGYCFLVGLPREVPKYIIDIDASEAFLSGYDRAAKLWPTPETQEWFTP